MSARALLRTELSKVLHCPSLQVSITPDARGKPLLADKTIPWHFNVSHSGDWLLLALTTSGAIGVDIECIDRRHDYRSLARRYFSTEEQHSLEQSSDPLNCFYSIWTCKEALLKAMGDGFGFGLKNFSVTAPFPMHMTQACRVEFARAQKGGDWYNYLLSAPEQYCAALASRNNQLSLQLHATAHFAIAE